MPERFPIPEAGSGQATLDGHYRRASAAFVVEPLTRVRAGCACTRQVHTGKDAIWRRHGAPFTADELMTAWV